MDRKKQIKSDYKRQQPVAGVFQLRCLANNKIYFGSSLNLHGPFDRLRFELGIGSFRNTRLQEDWKKYGEAQFAFEILETVPIQTDPAYDYAEDLSILEQIWLDKLDPFGDNGYNVEKRIRMA
jgi:group I intron endonuclease